MRKRILLRHEEEAAGEADAAFWELERKVMSGSQEWTRLFTFYDFSVPIMAFLIRLQDHMNWRKE